MLIMDVRIGSFSAPVWIMDDEGLIDLQRVHGQVLEPAQRGIAGAEVIQRHPDAGLAEAASCWITWQSSSKKTLSVTSRTSCRGSTPQDSVTARTSSAKSPCCSCTPETLTARDREGSSAQPGLQLRAAPEQHLGADLDDQAAALRRRNELLRRDESRRRGPSGPGPRP